MKYSGIIYNDVTAAPGVCVTLFVQGCPIHCPGCHNPEAQDFEGGKEFTSEVLESLLAGITANNIQRKLCIMGGEPMCNENIFLTLMVVSEAKKRYPWLEIYLWSGYTYEELLTRSKSESKIDLILKDVKVLIDGPYDETQRDITLPLRGSHNQRIILLDNNKKI